MRKYGALVLILLPVILLAQNRERRAVFFLHLAQLEFDKAKRSALTETDESLKAEMLQLTDILYYEGQKDRNYFNSPETKSTAPISDELSFIRALSAGYLSLFYDKGKGLAYRDFYRAYQLAKKVDDASLVKASLLAFFKYYTFEIAQLSGSYETYLDQLEAVKSEPVDEVWLVIYRMIFYSNIPTSLGALDQRYFAVGKSLDVYERTLSANSPLLIYVLYEKAVKLEIEKDTSRAISYYKKAATQSNDSPFLRDKRFACYLKLFQLAALRSDLKETRHYLDMAKQEVNLADTLRSNHHLNLYRALLLYRPLGMYDSAFLFLEKAYFQEYQLDFRKNTVEINKLNVELETQEKENAVLRLRQDRTWLVGALVGAALLLVLSYSVHTIQRSKAKIQQQEKEVSAMKLEKLLKDHEMFGIDSMIEGQEKERQRIANDLHDNLGSMLSAVILRLDGLKEQLKHPDSDSGEVQEANNLVNEAYQRVRSMAHAGNVGVNAQDGLLPAVRRFASKVSVLNKLSIDVEEHGMDKRMDNSLEITIFRIIQELITNVIKHAHAKEVTIHLTQHEKSINIMVEDDGVGFQLSEIKPGDTMGLHSIQKRIERLGGQVTIDSILQSGTTVIIDVPLT